MKKLIIASGFIWMGLLSIGLSGMFAQSAYASTYYTKPDGKGGYTTTDTVWGGQGL